MKRKPDAMIALIALFFVGLVVSGFSTMSVGSDDGQAKNRQVSTDQPVSRY
jgi:hypothetical protein